MSIAGTRQRIEDYAVGRSWFWYLPLWLFGLYLFFQIVGYGPGRQLALPVLIASSFDFALHEIAHIVTALLPSLLTAAAGSLSELLLGCLLVFVAFRTRGYFASLFCCLWLMLACQSVGIYMADARAQRLDLVSLGAALSGSDTAEHDWHFIFGQFHLLGMDTFIGGMVRFIGILVGLAGLIFALWLMYKMATTGGRPKRLDPQESMMLEVAAAEARRTAPSQHPKSSAPLYPTPSTGPLADEPPASDAESHGASAQ